MGDIKSHFVPKFYLENFGNPIFCYDKKDEIIFKSNAKNLGYEKNFYGKPDQDNKHELEYALSRLESKANVAISEVISTKNYSNLSDENKNNLCVFTALQYLRTQETRLRIGELKEKVLNEIGKQMGINDWKIKITDDGKTSSHLNTMKEYVPIATALKNMGTITFENITDRPLWTSDNPVVFFNEYDQFPWGNLGIASKGIEIHLPLTPTLGLTFYDPTTYSLPEIASMGEENVIRENSLQTAWSTRFVYSNNEEFNMMKNYLQSNPEIKDQKQRVNSGIHELKPQDSVNKKLHDKPEFWFDPSELEKTRK